MREDMKMIPMLKEWFSKRKDGRPSALMPEQQPDMKLFLSESDVPRVIWFGHSTFLLNLGGTIVLVDPVFGKAAAPVSFTAKRFQAPVLSIEELPPIDIVLISHDHYDHLDADTIRFFRNQASEFLTPLGVGGHLQRWGIARERITERDWWQSHTSHGIEFTAAPAQHFSGRDGFNNNETLWASWALVKGGNRLFFSGDSGYDTHFAEIGERLGPFDLAFMENGQYDKSWPAVHMNPAETVKAFKQLGARRLLPVHWGMFELAFHAWYAPVDALERLAAENDIELITPMLGELITLDDSLTTTRWWQSE
jgi:L-ascorbate metabolism protein UlaG (beta-lactamase superfamily)